MANVFPLKEVEQHFKQVLQYAPGMLGNDAVNFFLDRFKDQAWLGDTREPWKPRKAQSKWGKTPRNKGRAILIDSGRLRRSIRIVSNSGGTVTIGTDVPYAKAHNEGSRLGLIQNVKSYTRKLNRTGIVKHTTLKNRSNITFGRVQTGTTTVAAHTRRINQNIPRRQFMGSSPYLTKQLQRRLMAELMKGLRTT
jgi:phage gpG-like protein